MPELGGTPQLAPLNLGADSAATGGLLGVLAALPQMRIQREQAQLGLAIERQKFYGEQWDKLTGMLDQNGDLQHDPRFISSIAQAAQGIGIPLPRRIDAQGRQVLDTSAILAGQMQKWFNDPTNRDRWNSWTTSEDPNSERVAFKAQHPNWPWDKFPQLLTETQVVPFGQQTTYNKNLSAQIAEMFTKGFSIDQAMEVLGPQRQQYETLHGPGSFDRDITAQFKAGLTQMAQAQISGISARNQAEATRALAALENANSAAELRKAQAKWYDVRAADQAGLDEAKMEQLHASAIHLQSLAEKVRTGGMSPQDLHNTTTSAQSAASELQKEADKYTAASERLRAAVQADVASGNIADTDVANDPRTIQANQFDARAKDDQTQATEMQNIATQGVYALAHRAGQAPSGKKTNIRYSESRKAWYYDLNGQTFMTTKDPSK